MKHLYRGAALATAVGLFFSASLHAQLVQHAKTCNGCTASQIEALLPNCSLGYLYVADFDADRLYLGCYKQKGIVPMYKGADTSSGVTPQFGVPQQRSYIYRQPPANEQNTFQAYQNVYALNGHVMAENSKVNIDLSPVVSFGDDGHMNAYDMVNAIQNRDAVTNWLATTMFATSNTQSIPVVSPELTAMLANLLNDIKTGIISFDFAINVTLVFHDGSQVTFAYNPHDGTWSYVPGTARDAHGNLIPDDYAAISSGGGFYHFANPYPNYDLLNFMRTLREYNIQPSGSTTTVLECVTVDKQVTCHFVTVPE